MATVSGGQVILETERLTLRAWADGDEALLALHCNSPAVMRWTGKVQNREEIGAGIARSRASQEARGHCYWVVERKSDAAFLGFCGLRIANAEPFKLRGALAWWLWGVAHIYYLVGVRARLSVVLNWLWIHFRNQRSARLITNEQSRSG